jgi:hypothetical protein
MSIRQQRRFRCTKTRKPWLKPEIPDLLGELGSEEEKKQPSLKIPGYKMLSGSYPITGAVQLTKC